MRKPATRQPVIGTLAIAIVKSIDAVYVDAHKMAKLNELRSLIDDIAMDAGMSGDVSENLTDTLEEFSDLLDSQAKRRLS